MRRYRRRKLFEHANEKAIKRIKAAYLKDLAYRAFRKFAVKAKEVKGDLIQTRLLDASSDEVILGKRNEFVILNPDLEFVSIQSNQV